MEFDPDTARAIETHRTEQRLGVSEAVHELIRRGLVARPSGPPFRQRTAPLALSADVSSIADALEVLEGPTAR